MIYRAYSRHFAGGVDEHDDLQKAIKLQQYLSDAGEDYGIGIYDSNTNAVYLPIDTMLDDEHRLRRLRELCGLNPNHIFTSCYHFPFLPEEND